MLMHAMLYAVSAEEVLYGYGPLGIGVVALSVVGYKMFNIILKDRDKAIADRDALLEDLFTKVLPAIARNTELLDDRKDIDRVTIETIKASNAQLESNRRVLDEVGYMLKHGRRGDPAGGT